MTDDFAYYQALLDADPDLREYLCWTVIEPITKPVTVPDVIRTLGGEPESVRLKDRDAWMESGATVFVGQAGTAVTMLEFGYQGIRAEVLRWLSDGARVHAAYWDVNARSQLSYALYGQEVVTIRDGAVDDPEGDDPAGFARAEFCAQLEQLAPGSVGYGTDWYAALLTLIERRTGVRLAAEHLLWPQPGVELDEPIRDDPGVPSVLASRDADLDATLRMADPQAGRAAVVGVLRSLPGRCGLGGERHIQAILTALEAGTPVDHADILGLEALRQQIYGDAGPRGHTVLAIQHASFGHPPMPGTPADIWGAHTSGLFYALTHAAQALGDDWPHVRAALVAAVRG